MIKEGATSPGSGPREQVMSTEKKEEAERCKVQGEWRPFEREGCWEYVKPYV